jgi:hypothetical protein
MPVFEMLLFSRFCRFRLKLLNLRSVEFYQCSVLLQNWFELNHADWVFVLVNIVFKPIHFII